MIEWPNTRFFHKNRQYLQRNRFMELTPPLFSLTSAHKFLEVTQILAFVLDT